MSEEVESNGEKAVTRREIATAFKSHEKIHEIHKRAHDAEHAAVEKALTKADEGLEKRLEGMNEFRAQLSVQANTFISRELFEQYTKEQRLREEGLASSAFAKHESVEDQIEIERQARIRLEAQISTWRGIILFLGMPGVVALLWTILATFSGQAVTGPNGFIP